MDVVDSDFSVLEGTYCFCSEESAALIRQKISSLPLHAVHLLGTGGYHYITLLWLEMVSEPFSLVLFDNHPDDLHGAFGDDMLSCGNWVLRVRTLPLLKDVLWIRDVQDTARFPSLDDGLVYVSVDLDVLSPDYAHTDWNQGDMTLGELKKALTILCDSHRIAGADICGGQGTQKKASSVDFALNKTAEETLIKLFCRI